MCSHLCVVHLYYKVSEIGETQLLKVLYSVLDLLNILYYSINIEPSESAFAAFLRVVEMVHNKFMRISQS